MKRYAILGIALFWSSCSINTDIIGKYSDRISNNIQFKADSTFIYEYRALHLYQYSKGIWKRTGKNYISLTSDIKSTTVPILVNSDVSSDDMNEISIELNIERGKELSDYKCGIYVNNSLYGIKRCDSLSRISINIPINNIYFHFTKEPQIASTTYIAPPVSTSMYQPKAIKGNRMAIKIAFPEAYFYYKSFNGNVAMVKRNGIQIATNSWGKREKIPKISDDANIFSGFESRSK